MSAAGADAILSNLIARWCTSRRRRPISKYRTALRKPEVNQP